MNIQSSFDPAQPLRESQASRSATPQTAEASSGASRPAVLADGDTASISAAAVAAASGVSDVRMEKVAAIQEALASGTYAVSAGDVADKLIDRLLQG